MEKYTYEVLNEGAINEIIQRSDGASIPKSEANADYQAYLNRDNPDWNKPHTLQEETAK
jgi:hypothetical protein